MSGVVCVSPRQSVPQTSPRPSGEQAIYRCPAECLVSCITFHAPVSVPGLHSLHHCDAERNPGQGLCWLTVKFLHWVPVIFTKCLPLFYRLSIFQREGWTDKCRSCKILGHKIQFLGEKEKERVAGFTWIQLSCMSGSRTDRRITAWPDELLPSQFHQLLGARGGWGERQEGYITCHECRGQNERCRCLWCWTELSQECCLLLSETRVRPWGTLRQRFFPHSLQTWLLIIPLFVLCIRRNSRLPGADSCMGRPSHITKKKNAKLFHRWWIWLKAFNGASNADALRGRQSAAAH